MAALRATIRESVNGVTQNKQVIALDKPTIKIGRGLSCDVRIGDKFDRTVATSISRVQATITVAEDGTIALVDGTPEQRSSNRCFVNGKPIDEPYPLIPGATATLFKTPEAMVQLAVESGPSQDEDTYTGGLLLEAFQEKLEALTTQVELMQEHNIQMQGQVDRMDAQMTERSKVDSQQTQLITDLDRRLRKAVSAALIAFAVALMGFTLTGNLSPEERGEWRKTLVQVVQVLASVAVAGVGIKLNQGEGKAEAKP